MEKFLISYDLILKRIEEGWEMEQKNRVMFVEAESEDKSIETLLKYYENKSDEKKITYSIDNSVIVRTINQFDILEGES